MQFYGCKDRLYDHSTIVVQDRSTIVVWDRSMIVVWYKSTHIPVRTYIVETMFNIAIVFCT